MALQALLFDLDGTLADTDRYHALAFQLVFAERGVRLTPALYQQRISGKHNPVIMREWFPELSEAEQQALSAHKEATYRQLASTLAPLPGLMRLLAWGRAQGLKLGLVTNAERANVDFALTAMGLADAFDVQVLPEGIPGKPDPAPYRRALSLLGVKPDEALAFEDSRAGIAAAQAAGCAVVGVTTGLDAEALLALGCTLAIATFEDEALWRYLDASSKSAVLT